MGASLLALAKSIYYSAISVFVLNVASYDNYDAN